MTNEQLIAELVEFLEDISTSEDEHHRPTYDANRAKKALAKAAAHKPDEVCVDGGKILEILSDHDRIGGAGYSSEEALEQILSSITTCTVADVRKEAFEEAAQYVESKAPYSEEQINNTDALTQMDHIDDVLKSNQAREYAKGIRALSNETPA